MAENKNVVKITSAILRNKGVPIKLHVLDDDGQRVYNNGKPVFEETNFRLTNWHIAEIEDRIGGRDAFQQKLEESNRKLVVDLLALALDRFPPDIGMAMIDGDFPIYEAAIAAGLAINQGLPLDVVGNFLAAGNAAATEMRKQLDALAKTMDVGSPGTTGTEPGDEPADPSTSSGD